MDFTLGEYGRQEARYKDEKKSAKLSYLSSLRRDLSSGITRNVGRVVVDDKASQITDADDSREFREIEQELSKVQSSNLINAQRAYTLNLEGRLSGGASVMEVRKSKAADEQDAQVAALQGTSCSEHSKWRELG